MEKAQAEQQAYEERAKKIEAADNAVPLEEPRDPRPGRARPRRRSPGRAPCPPSSSSCSPTPNYDVRIAACQALGSLGPAARSALPNIDGVLRQPPYEPPINATAEQLDAQMKDGDYRRCLRDAKAKIGR